MTNPHKGRTGLDRIVRATGYSMSGLAMAYRGESAFRQEFWLAVILLPSAFWLGRSWVEVALLAGSVLLVLIVELLNSSIEAAIDRISFEMHDLSKRAKDLASAAVLLSLLLCGGIWLAALWQRFGATA
ncbi:MAG TPA: diacylglycerol kinase [Piscinibacter sp.]|jgi:diacylglycerol kinase (ATP)|uniref:diacylglycerol kinase n=1 Tax=Piscinibacter sp. TaxID=1903157 RepID=UPI0011D7FC31|nr:diacylglycerol kinase [Piscinibacter sp.]TXH54793.1 MAG: diacylglycerol kinase [Burkholderiaceae bacterium]MBP5990357.1 diacylglycerol kinase [Piscinibacter sp.]MBP6028958.1 diacylglycerol kinase [Piscinibacter sp.]HMZ02495.1 diacylglycerol kinase [Burkholderiaceae bacterium]HNJ84375.1 diacylglycerol kinase [Piscinibacter sp.]